MEEGERGEMKKVSKVKTRGPHQKFLSSFVHVNFPNWEGRHLIGNLARDWSTAT